jgi:two-component system, NarL family, sensor histidine kinase UhpB
MSLRRRLLSSISLVLIASLLLGGLLTYWQSWRKIEIEMTAALAVGTAKIEDALARPTPIEASGETGQRIVALFDGDRHLRARLVAADGEELAWSRVRAPVTPAPGWLVTLLGWVPQTKSFALEDREPKGHSVALTADPLNEIAEIWDEIILKFVIVAGFCIFVLAAVLATLHHALKPLERLSAALVRVGEGRFDTHVAAEGATELVGISTEFNRMADALRRLEDQNDALKEQLASVQEEERAEIARDLHDEFGPFLFAVEADAQTIAPLLQRGAADAVADSAQRIRQSTQHMQTHLRAILGRLKPANLLDQGFGHAAENLVTFWQARRPGIQFTTMIDDIPAHPEIEQVAFRVLQEGISNAVRHGNPKTVHLSAQRTMAGRLRINVRDDGRGLKHKPGRGFGLAGMRERVAAVGGQITFEAAGDESGVSLTAELPLDLTDKKQSEAQDTEMGPS